MSQSLEIEYKNILKIRKFQRKNYKNAESVSLPFDIKNVIFTGLNLTDIEGDKDITRENIFLNVDKFCKSIVGFIYGNNIKRINKEIYANRFRDTIFTIYEYMGSKQLKKKGITQYKLEWILNKLLEIIVESIIVPGTSIGIIIATIHGRNATQAMLDAFHKLGFSVEGVGTVQNFDRLVDVINATHWADNPEKVGRNQSIFTNIYLIDDGHDHVKKASLFNPSYLKNATHSMQIINDPDFFMGKTNMRKDSKLLKFTLNTLHEEEISYVKRFKFYRHIRIEFNIQKLYNYNLNISEISAIIYKKIKEFNKNYDMDKIFKFVLLGENVIRICISSFIKDELDILNVVKNGVLLKLQLQGIKNIKNAKYTHKISKEYNDKLDKYEDIEYHMLETMGTNMNEIYKLPFVNREKTISNSIWETYEALGIEAARCIIFKSIELVYFATKISINPGHIVHIANMQTVCGKPTSLRFNGLNKFNDIEVIQRKTHQRTEKVLVESSIRGAIDTLSSPSATTMYMQGGICGTASNFIGK